MLYANGEIANKLIKDMKITIKKKVAIAISIVASLQTFIYENKIFKMSRKEKFSNSFYDTSQLSAFPHSVDRTICMQD